MFSISNKEIDDCPKLGKTVLCRMCGKRHRISYGESVLDDGSKVPSNMFAFYKCNGQEYLAGINGKDIRRK